MSEGPNVNHRKGNDMKIVVIGGTGRVGSNVVRRLSAQGNEAVAASPGTGVNTITREGLDDVMVGADVVVDVSNAPVWDDDAVLEFFTTSTRNLLEAERAADVGHHLAVSIVGADLLPDSGYLRAKVALETEIEAGQVPYTILRATQFFEFLPQIVETGAEAACGCRRGCSSSWQPTTSPRRFPSWRQALLPEAGSSWVDRSDWVWMPGRGACLPPPATRARWSVTPTRSTTAPSCTVAS
jgi:hypothetical protein